MMNALQSTKWLALGLGVYALATLACSAEASQPPPQEGANNESVGGKGNGAAGSGTALPSAGTTTNLPSAGTTANGTGGTPATGAAGTAATGTAGTGTATGGQSGGALTTCPVPPAAGTATELLIDDLEDGDNGVSKVGGRSGYWYTYLDALGSTIVPKPDPAGASPLVPGSTMCHGGMKCVLISGTTAMADETEMKYPYAGVGFDFSNAKKPCVYNGGAYTGIKFWARGDVPITIKLNTAATATPDGGGTCSGDGCNGGYSPMGADVVLTPEWQEITIPFATAAGPAWAIASTVPLAKASLLSLQVQIPAGQTYSIALDDFTFY